MATMRTSEDVMTFGEIIDREKCVSFSKVTCLWVSKERDGRAEFISQFGFHSNRPK
jgi:hypothetical protein